MGAAGIETAKPVPQRREFAGEIRLGQDQSVGNRRLLDRFRLAIELIHGVDGVYRDDDPVQAIDVRKQRVLHQGLEDRRWIGQARGLDHDPPEVRDLALGPAFEQAAERVHQIAAHGAAEAAARQQYHVFPRSLDQEMIQADLAELVDHDCRVAELRPRQQVFEQGRLAAAEKAGQHRNRQALGRLDFVHCRPR